jgi:hypothetical protein
MSTGRFARFLVLSFATTFLLLAAPFPSVASGAVSSNSSGTATTATPLPSGGTVTEIDALIETNLTFTATGETVPLSVHSVAHAKCASQPAVYDANSGHYEFTNSFSTLQASFNQTPMGPVVISKNPKLPINGVHTTFSDQPVFPVHSKIRLFLQISMNGQTLVNRDPIILEADINAWPQVGAMYQATTGNIDFYAQDADGNPTGSSVAQLFGTHVTIEAGRTLTADTPTSSSTSSP